MHDRDSVSQTQRTLNAKTTPVRRETVAIDTTKATCIKQAVEHAVGLGLGGGAAAMRDGRTNDIG